MWADGEESQGLRLHRVVDATVAMSLVAGGLVADDEEPAEDLRTREGARQKPGTMTQGE